MAIYRGEGGTGDTTRGESVEGPNTTITQLTGIEGPIKKPTLIEFAVGDLNPTPRQLTWDTSEDKLAIGLVSGDEHVLTTADIGVDVQAYSANLDEFATVNPTTAGLALLDDVDAAAQRNTLGLGTAATTDSTDYATSAQGALADTSVQPGDNISDLNNDVGYSTTTGTVTSIDLTAGTGVSVSGGPITSSGSITVTNTAPDQTVVLTGSTGISTSGTYPNFTITNSDTGSAQNIFKNVAVSGQSTVVADSNNDTLTLVGGSNVTITTDASTDTITIAASGGGGGGSIIEQGNSSVEVIDTGTDGRVVITTDGVESARFTTDGNVLIGTDTNPDGYKLLTAFALPDDNTGYVGNGVWVNEDLEEVSAVVVGIDGGGVVALSGYGVLETTEGDLVLRAKEIFKLFTADGVEIIRVDENVLIGTTSNPSDYRLVVGDIAYADNYDIGLTTEGSDTVALDFSGGTGLSTRSATGTVTFTASNYRAGAIKTVRVIAGGSSRTLTFPTNWVFVGAKPASIASGKTGILTVTSFGTTEADCVAAWAVQT